MAGSRTDRRNGKDRRFAAKTAPPQERRGCDRRQFPPRDHSQRPSAAALSPRRPSMNTNWRAA